MLASGDLRRKPQQNANILFFVELDWEEEWRESENLLRNRGVLKESAKGSLVQYGRRFGFLASKLDMLPHNKFTFEYAGRHHTLNEQRAYPYYTYYTHYTQPDAGGLQHPLRPRPSQMGSSRCQRTCEGESGWVPSQP